MSLPASPVDPATIPLGLLRRYLQASQWETIELAGSSPLPDNPAARILMTGRTDAVRNFDIFVSKISDLRGIELIVPRSRDGVEYAYQVEKLIAALSSIEDRSPSAIAESIRQIGFDVLQSRIPDRYVLDDTIHLSTARSFITQIRAVLASTATTELQPAPYFLRLLKEATDYADRCRFGHTFKGSFGFTVESPLTPNDQASIPGIPGPAPFERRVVQRLAAGLANVRRAVSAGSTDPIVNTTKQGFSANICETLAALIEETSHSSLIFDIRFSAEWPVIGDKAERQTFELGREHAEVIREAAKVLRSSPWSEEAVVFGRVIRLASEVDPSDMTDIMGEREVAMLWSSEALGDITVRASLSPPDYLTALGAHASGRPVQVSGTLERRRRRWVLLNPTGFHVPGEG
jgi:hypothetical protein